MTSILVGIPTLNGPGRLDRALQAIEDHTDMDRYADLKLLVCDDGSKSEHLETYRNVIAKYGKLRERFGLEMILHGERKGIAKSWNDLTRYKNADVTVLLNDDVEVVHHWIAALVYTLTRNQRIGMVGLNSRVNVTKHDVKQLHPTVDEHIRIPRIDYCEAKMLDGNGALLSSQGCAFGFTREAYEVAGGFDERYRCFYEETDFGITLRRSGRRNYMLSYPIIFHQGGATTSDPSNFNASEEMARSHQLFVEKWGKTLGQFRDEFVMDPCVAGRLYEWNTQIHNWR